MFKKRLLATSALLSLLAMTSVAQAGPTISDKRHWPNEARSTGAYPDARTDWRKARAQAIKTTPRAAEPQVDSGQSSPRYLGGPKTGLTVFW
jgi:hypothetical protein